MGALVWSPLANGMLTGRDRKGQAPPKSLRVKVFPKQMYDERHLEAVERLIPIVEQAGLSLTHMAMAFVMAHPGVTSAIPGPPHDAARLWDRQHQHVEGESPNSSPINVPRSNLRKSRGGKSNNTSGAASALVAQPEFQLPERHGPFTPFSWPQQPRCSIGCSRFPRSH